MAQSTKTSTSSFHQFDQSQSRHHSWNLHSVWDTGIIEVVLRRDYNNSRQALEEDLYHYTDIAYGTDGTTDDCAFGGLKSCVILWAEESWDYASKYAYVLSDNITQVKDGSIIDELYYETRLPIVKIQLVKAGIRLAKTLEIIAENYYHHGSASSN